MLDDSFEGRNDLGAFAGGSKAMLDDSFEDRRDSGGFEGGTKGVCDDSFTDRSDFYGFAFREVPISGCGLLKKKVQWSG